MELISDNIPTLPAGTRHYRVRPGEYIAVMVDEGVESPGVEAMLGEAFKILGIDAHHTTRLARPTQVLSVNEFGEPLDMTPIRTFPPGTTHEQAIAEFEE
jgi:hypothetical protein